MCRKAEPRGLGFAGMVRGLVGDLVGSGLGWGLGQGLAFGDFVQGTDK